MIQLPVGFDYNVLVNDFFGLVSPFMGIVFIIVCYRVIRRTANSI